MDAYRKGEVVLEVATLLGRLPGDDLARIAGGLGVSGGRDQLRELLVAFYRQDAETRAAIVRRLGELRRFTVHRPSGPA